MLVWYVDDTFVFLNHREEEFHSFLGHMNSINQRIHFTTEREVDDNLEFLDVLVLRRTKVLHRDSKSSSQAKACLDKDVYALTGLCVFGSLNTLTKRLDILMQCCSRMVTLLYR